VWWTFRGRAGRGDEEADTEETPTGRQ